MSIIPPVIPPLGNFPGYGAPFPNSAVFVYRDGETLLEYVERLKKYVVEEVAPHIDAASAVLIEEFVKQVDAVILSVNNALANQSAEILSELAEAVDAITNSTIVITDPVVNGLLTNVDSATRAFMENYFRDGIDSRSYPELYALNKVDSVATDAAPFIQTLLNRAVTLGLKSATIYGQYVVRSSITIPDAIEEIIIPAGSKIRAKGTSEIFIKRGGVEFIGNLADTTSIPVNTRVMNVPDLRAYVGVTWMLISTRAPLNGTNGNYPGWIRRVGSLIPDTGTFDPNNPGTTVVPGKVTFDRIIPREAVPHASLTGEYKAIKIYKYNFASTVRIHGGGMLEGVGKVSPVSAQRALVSLSFMLNPQIGNIEIANHSRSLIEIEHVLGGRIDGAYIHDSFDTGSGGYGITINGAVRGLVTTPSTTIESVRHTTTTNAGPEFGPTGLRGTDPSVPGYGANGEPEACVFAHEARNTSDKAVDSHRLGINNSYKLRVFGGAGGLQIREDAAIVTGDIFNVNGRGITVDSLVTIAPTIRNVFIDGTSNSGEGEGLFAGSKVNVDGLTIRGIVGSRAIRFDSSESVCVNVHVDNVSGIFFNPGAKNNYVEAYFTDRATEWFTESSSATTYGNTVVNMRMPRGMKIWPNVPGSTVHFFSLTDVFSSLALADGTLDFEPIELPMCTLVEMAVSSTTFTAGAQGVVGIYSSTPDGAPGTLIAQGLTTLDFGTASGNKVASFDSNIKLNVGRYYKAFMLVGGGVTMRHNTLTPDKNWQTSNDLSSLFSNAPFKAGYRKTGQSGLVLPGTASGLSTTKDITRMIVKVRV